MQVSVETTTGLERQLTVVVPADRVDSDVAKRVQETARTVRLDGFRPGKVPVKVVKKRYGQGIRQEVIGEVVQQSFYEAIQQESLTPAGGPNVEFKTDKEGEDFSYTATFEVYPEITLADFSGVEIEKNSAEVKDADLDQMIDTLQKQQAAYEEADKAAAEGDQLNIDFEGFIDGEAFDGGTAAGMDLVLGSNTMIPGFETALEGAKAGEEKEVNVTFPEEYHAENLKGKAAKFNVKVNKVSAQVLPELNEEFFAKFGIEEKSVDSFKVEVRKNMERELNQALKSKLKEAVFGQLVEVNAIDVPTALIDGEIDAMRRQAIQQFGGADANIDPNMLPKEMFSEQAEKRVKVGLLVSEVVKANELKVDDDRVRTTVEELAATYQEPQEVIDWYYSNQDMLNQIQNLVLEDQVLDLLLDSAKVTETELSYEDAIKPAAAPVAEEAEEEA
ncbi:trigger factor [Amphritea sp. 2_MG-2023]|uniref:trigger factor n=1 Tax=Amphritea TaxID=515417 RepID=UPI001C06B8A1|nr:MULTISPECIES: trigger factor [Amphritea]MBU2966608.1 trigger factor [Amphritea atlantica]MDO6417533.1 trigger factor [Amphritea sp. 2_MG-2023]